MNPRKISAIARPVDPSFPTNRAIGAIAIALTVGDFLWRLLTGADLLTSGWAAIGLGLTVFLTWALCREVDPDRDLSAFVAAGLALVGKLLWGTPDLAMIFWLLLAVRIVNRSTGLRATIPDSVGIMALATWLTFRIWWPIGAFTAIAFWLDGWLYQPHLRHRMVGFIAVALTLSAGFLATTTWRYHGPHWASAGIAIVMCFVFVPVIVSARTMNTLADETKECLNIWRVRASQMLALIFGLTAVVWTGVDGLVLLWPLWSAVVGSSAFLLLKSVLA